MLLKSFSLKVVLIVGSLLVLAACAHQPLADVAGSPGFWAGVLHGLIVPGALIASIWNDVRIYAFPNNGGWYDLGFTFGGFVVSCIIVMVLGAIHR